LRVLVVGASGFLGAHTYQLLKNKREPLVTGTYGRRAVFPDLYQVNLTSRQSVRSLIKTTDPDTVLWCAKHTEGTEGSLESEMNFVGIRSLIESAKPSMRLIFVSTDGLLPGTQGHYDEDTEPVPIDCDSDVALYTNSKLETEKFISSAWDNHCIVRVGPIYGRSITGEWDSRVSRLVDAFRRGEPVLRATNIRRTFIHVEDLAKAMCELSVSSYKGILHLGPAESLSYFDFATIVAEVFGFSAQLVQPYVVSNEEVIAKAIRVDTSLNTRIAERVLESRFRTLKQGMLDTHKSQSQGNKLLRFKKKSATQPCKE
jgi:dTDP-4-dehydrorhamnose reductase